RAPPARLDRGRRREGISRVQACRLAAAQEGRDVDVVGRELRLFLFFLTRGRGARRHLARRGGPLAAAAGAAGRRPLLPILLLQYLATRGQRTLEAGGNDGDPHPVFHRLVDDGAENHVGVWMSGLADDGRGLVDLVK